MKITKDINGKTVTYYSETLDAFRTYATSVVSALTCIHKTKESVAEARVSWFIAAGEQLRTPSNEDATLLMLVTKQKDRTAKQTALYNTLSKAWNRFKDQHGLEKGKKRGSAAKGEAPKKAKAETDVTPKANNAAAADKFLRQHTAMLLAYCEKNKAVIPDAWRHAIAELNEAGKHIPQD